MDRIKYIIASLVLTCMGGAFISARCGEAVIALRNLNPGYEVRGTVVDDLGPVAGAAVVEKGTSNGTSTDLDGRFSLMVSGPEAVVEISCIGYAGQTYEAGSLPPVITLKEDSEYLDEIVVIGYGTVKKLVYNTSNTCSHGKETSIAFDLPKLTCVFLKKLPD